MLYKSAFSRRYLVRLILRGLHLNFQIRCVFVRITIWRKHLKFWLGFSCYAIYSCNSGSLGKAYGVALSPSLDWRKIIFQFEIRSAGVQPYQRTSCQLVKILNLIYASTFPILRAV